MSRISAATDIVHLDLDCFYAAVEALADPSLAGKPIIVGGTGGRGVVASASYEARAYGVRSAMPTLQARQLCPSGVFVSPNFSSYRAYHEQLMEVLTSMTPIIEPIALDEAFLDVRGAHRVWGSSKDIAEKLRRRVLEELQLVCSVGVGRTKLVAKLASKAAKPIPAIEGPRVGTGVLVVDVDEELAFIHAHAVRALPGIGPRTEERLARLGITTVRDLAEIGRTTLVSHFGRSHGAALADLAAGVDERPVTTERASRSIGHEETFDVDEFELEGLVHRAKAMATSVATRCREAGYGGRTVSIKVRYADFSIVTRAKTAPQPVTSAHEIAEIATGLLQGLGFAQGVRLLGISMSALEAIAEAPSRQLSLFGNGADAEVDTCQREQLEETADAIRRRFGAKAIGALAHVHDAPTRDSARLPAPKD